MIWPLGNSTIRPPRNSMIWPPGNSKMGNRASLKGSENAAQGERSDALGRDAGHLALKGRNTLAPFQGLSKRSSSPRAALRSALGCTMSARRAEGLRAEELNFRQGRVGRRVGQAALIRRPHNRGQLCHYSRNYGAYDKRTLGETLPGTGFEPAQPFGSPAPQAGASASSATRAKLHKASPSQSACQEKPEKPGIGNRESGIGNRESGIGKRETETGSGVSLGGMITLLLG